MATNLKGQGGIKGLLLLHGEKIAISLIGLIALWLIYKTTTLPRLESRYQASKLRDEITQTTNAVRESQWPEKGTDLVAEIREAVPINEKADNPVSDKPYAISSLDSAIIAPTVLRTDPTLVNAVDVRATGGSGLFAFIDEKIRKAQELKRAAEEAERVKKEADKLEKQQQQQQTEQPGSGRRGRNAEGEGLMEVFDPAHPNRRPVEGMSRALGVPLQGGERIERAYWALVVAKVPIREQLKLYQDAFEKAKLGFDPARDFPQYKGFLVQRSEVVPGKPLDWKAVPVYDGQRQSILANKPIHASAVGTTVVNKLYELAGQFWAGMSPDVIDQRFSDYILTLPLPPLVGRDWGSDATHPDIPLLINTPPLEEETQVLAAEPTKPQAETDPFNSTDPSQAGPGAVAMPGRPMGEFQGMGARGFGPGAGRFRGGEMMGPMGQGGRGLEGQRYGSEGGPGRSFTGGMSGAAGTRTSLPKGVDYLLLRFFDFAVEPGKKYKYRVTLVLADPNYIMPDNTLAPAVLDRRRQDAQAAKAQNRARPDFRKIEDWSEPSPTVGIPLSGNVRLAEVKLPPAEKFNDEPLAKLLVESFDLDEKTGDAIQAAKEREFRRGSVANIVEDAEYLGPGGIWIDTREGYKFLTGMTLIDVDGGNKLTKDFNAPARVLVMGQSGELYIRNELDDKPAVEYHRFLFEKPDKRRGGVRGPDGMMPGQGGERGGFRSPPGGPGRGR